MNCPGLCRQYKNSLIGRRIKFLSNELILLFKRSPFCFRLHTVIVVEIDVFGCDEVVKWAKIKAYRI